jgi:SOS-response transcriptional repressor LexA
VENLTQKEQDTLLKIHQLYLKNGYMPTYREIARSLDMSIWCIQDRVARLIQKGYLMSGDGYARRSFRFAKAIEFNSNQIPVLGVIS